MVADRRFQLTLRSIVSAALALSMLAGVRPASAGEPGSTLYTFAARADGTVWYFGGEIGPPAAHLAAPVVGIAMVESGHVVIGSDGDPYDLSFWLAASDGGVFARSGAPFLGSAASIRLNRPVVGIASTPKGVGYWLVASDGGVFTFGDAEFFGSTGNLVLNRPIVAMLPTPTGRGYWLIASDGGVFTFGDAQFYGSAGSLKLAAPIVSAGATATGNGYWLVGRDGGVLTFGDAQFVGANPGPQPAVGIPAFHTCTGYEVVRTGGAIDFFGQHGCFDNGDARVFDGHGPFVTATARESTYGS